jgi:hypothetical protein
MDTDEKKYDLKLDRVNKVFHAQAHGFLKPEDANAFVTEYRNLIGQIKSDEYEFQFDCKKLNVSTQDMIPMLKGCVEMYKQSGFRKTIFDCTGNNTLKMQVRRVCNMVEFQNYEII